MTTESIIDLDLARLAALVDEGLRRARQGRRATLVSIVRRVRPSDPLDCFRRAAGLAADRFFWSNPAEGLDVAGVGAAWTTSVEGAGRFAEAAIGRRELVLHAVVDGEVEAVGAGPLLFGGFSFDPLRAKTVAWDGYPDGRLVLPRCMLTRADGEGWLTVNSVLWPDSDPGAALADLSGGSRAVTDTRGVVEADDPASRLIDAEDPISAAEWKAVVQSLVARIGRGEMEKAVLAREHRVYGERELDPGRVLRRLRAEYPTCFMFAVANRESCFLGASPERLVRLRGGTVSATCLAGSIARGATPEEDRALAGSLLASAKDRAEHAIVVRALHGAMADLGVELPPAGEPALMTVRNLHHLCTPVAGRVTNGRSVLDFVERLHPTPAVGGWPRDAALAAIRDCEALDRGWYAGPIGWLDTRGEGEFAVAIRSALLRGNQASLFAGCGIVADSDAEREYAESCLKLRPILSALNGETR